MSGLFRSPQFIQIHIYSILLVEVLRLLARPVNIHLRIEAIPLTKYILFATLYFVYYSFTLTVPANRSCLKPIIFLCGRQAPMKHSRLAEVLGCLILCFKHCVQHIGFLEVILGTKGL